MEITNVLSALNQLNADISKANHQKLLETCEKNIKLAFEQYSPPEQETMLINLCNDDSLIWRYISLNFQYLHTLVQYTGSYSVQQNKDLKNVIENIIRIGIVRNLTLNQSHLDSKESDEDISVLTRYNRLAATTYGLNLCMKSTELKLLINPNLNCILSALYQICFCPLKKPNSSLDSSFIMTEEIYKRLVKERELFKEMLMNLEIKIHPRIYVRETMLILTNSSPLWLKRAVSSTLSRIIQHPKGLENVAWALFDAAGFDDPSDTSQWKTLDVIAKIILHSRKSSNFPLEEQVIPLLRIQNRNGEFLHFFELIFALCTKMLYVEDKEICIKDFLPHIFNVFKQLNDFEFSDNEDITELIYQAIRLISACFIEENAGVPVLPLSHLTIYVELLFIFYMKTLTENTKSFNQEVKTILLFLLRNTEFVLLCDTLLYQLPNTEILKLRNGSDVYVNKNRFLIKSIDYSVRFSCLERANSLLGLIKQDPKLICSFFSYLLQCLIERDKYFPKTNSELLNIESEMILDQTTERNIATFKLLSDLAEDKNVQKCIGEEPDDFIKYIETVFDKTLKSQMHQTNEIESTGFQTVFLICMLLESLVENASTKETLTKYTRLQNPMEKLVKESNNMELKRILKTILEKINGLKVKRDRECSRSKFDMILEDIYDPLIPVRGHGLIALTKLILEQDKEAIERKQFILNIFQQNLKQEDSFIYLSAISGLAAMADIFTDTVLNILTDEYSEFTTNNEDSIETKMKIGEVLVRVTKLLGEMAPKYKSILLNCFLNGTKDDNHLIRASSLSNLAEVCRVLGYKLGTIVSEVLSCVHAVISTDKAMEPRRAAVMVIKQLLVGLEKETIVFLKDDILPIYRQLKYIYNTDKDDVMRLQAQLALEELNQNVKDFVFPHLPLHNEKSFLLLK